MSQYAPRIYTMTIPTDKIRDVIGPGGKMIRSIIEQTGVKIDVEDDGTVHVASATRHPPRKAMRMIGDITAVAEVGKTYLGKVVRLVDFGAFVEIFPGTDGLLHISEIAENRIREVRDELKEGDQILVKVLAIEGNKIKLSRKGGVARAARKTESQEVVLGNSPQRHESHVPLWRNVFYAARISASSNRPDSSRPSRRSGVRPVLSSARPIRNAEGTSSSAPLQNSAI